MRPESATFSSSDEAADRSAKVLLVEDDEVTRYAVARMLTTAGFNVATAGSGKDAVVAAREIRPDIALLDVGLPDMIGFEACAMLRRDPATAHTAVMFLSAAYVSAFDRVRGLDGGGDIYLTHPVEPTVLVATVRALLRVKRSNEQRELALARERDARREAEEARERLAAALRGREDALANVVHDLRSPLQTIELAARYLSETLSAEPDGPRRQLGIIGRACTQISSLVGNLLDLAKLQAGQIVLHLGNVETAALVEETFEAYRLAADEKQICFERVVSPGVHAVADVTRLRQVLANLVSNAMKFTPARGRVEVGVSRDNSGVVFWVRDTGPGIPPEEATHVFDRFWQARDGSTSGGAGLGLAIAKGIVEAHGGRIWLESRVGEGTLVSFTVPGSR